MRALFDCPMTDSIECEISILDPQDTGVLHPTECTKNHSLPPKYRRGSPLQYSVFRIYTVSPPPGLAVGYSKDPAFNRMFLLPGNVLYVTPEGGET
jgi:hypothetical protein